MKNLFLVVLLSLCLVGSSTRAWAASCSEGANCTACSNCSNCKHCSKRGGTCSVCRPDLYPSSTRSAPVYTPPTYSAAPSQRVAPPVYQPRTMRRDASPRAARVVVPAQWTGKCVGVSDGDTISVLWGGRAVRVRLYGVDAPEKRQAFGQQAKNFTSRFAFGKNVTIYSKGTDRYGRVLGWVLVGSQNLNANLVANGLAWWYRQYSPNEREIAQLEQKARGARRGLWRDAQPVAPWSWRRR